MAVFLLAQAIRDELLELDAEHVRYGTLETFMESRKLAEILGFKEHFRLAHAHHQPVPDPIILDKHIEISVPDDLQSVYGYLVDCDIVKPVNGYFFTWWDTRRFLFEYVVKAHQDDLIFVAEKDNRIDGAALFWYVPWQKFLVLSILDGSEDAIKALFNKAIDKLKQLGCNAFGIVCPTMEEMHQLQKLLNLPLHGSYTIQFLREK